MGLAGKVGFGKSRLAMVSRGSVLQVRCVAVAYGALRIGMDW